jgi:hypothetical protein
MSFALYLLGMVVLLIGVIYICHIAHLPQTWTIGLSLLLVGAGIISAVKNTKPIDRE